MNKAVLTTLMASAILVLSGCSSTGSHHSGYGGHSGGSYCPECGPGSHAVKHAHGGQRRGGGSSFATVAGALVVGGLLINALDDDDDSSGGHNK